MDQCKQLHETVVKDVIDVIDNVKDFDQIKWIKSKNSIGSINKRASNLILVFPVIISSALSMDTAIIISKAIERKCVSLMQILFSAIQITNTDNLYDYISKFHNNIDLSGKYISLDDFLNSMERIANEGTIEITDKDIYDAVMEDMKNINHVLSTSLNEHSINDYKIVNNMYSSSPSVVLEATPNTQAELIAKYGQSDSNVTNNYNITTVQKPSVFSPSSKDDVNLFRNQILPNDIQKANELMPTNMVVSFIMNDKDSGNVIRSNGVIGIKAKMYPVDSMDIIERITSKVKTKNGLFNLVRASTREISFFKDLAFAIDKSKADAIFMAKDSNNAKIFKLLERRAAKNKFSTLLKKNDASPITSLVLSHSEVEYLKKYNNLDLDKSHVTRTILEGYNLMDIIIADESLEIARFLYDDGDGTFETLTFDALEKEAKDKSYKKVINLMSQINR